MTNLENLPVWAKILLSIPVSNAASADHFEGQPNATSRQQGSVPSDAGGTKPSATLFGADSLDRQWRWQVVLRFAPNEFSS